MNDEFTQDGSSVAAHDVLLTEVASFQQSLRSVLTTLTASQRLAYVDTAVVLDMALDELHRHYVEVGTMPAALAKPVRSMIDRLQVPTAHFLSARSRAEQGRYLADLIRRIQESLDVVRLIAALAGDDAASVLDGWRIQSTEQVLESVGAQIDGKLRILAREIGETRTERERRAEKFKQEIDNYNGQIDDRLAMVNNEASATQQRFDEKMAAIEEAINDLQKRSAKLLDVVEYGAQSGMAKAAEQKDRTAADRWRLAAVAMAMLGVVPLVVEGLLGHGAWQPLGTTIRVSIAFACGGIASYMAKQSENHRRHARAQLDSVTWMPAAMAWIGDLSPSAQEEIKKELARRFRDKEHEKDDISGPSTLSIDPKTEMGKLLDRLSPRERELRGGSS